MLPCVLHNSLPLVGGWSRPKLMPYTKGTSRQQFLRVPTAAVARPSKSDPRLTQYTSILYYYTLALTPPPPRPPSLTLPMAYSTVWPLDNGAKQFHSSSPTTTSILPLSVLLLRNFVVVGDHSETNGWILFGLFCFHRTPCGGFCFWHYLHISFPRFK